MRKARKHRKWYFVAKRKFATKVTGHFKIFFIASVHQIGQFINVPPINIQHVFRGYFNGNRPVGFHHISGYSKTDRKIEIPFDKPRNAKGVYRAFAWFLNPVNNNWVRKTPSNSFFPNSWSQDKVLKEIRIAYSNAVFPYPNKPELWEGKCSEDINIRGYLMKIGGYKFIINTAFPIYRTFTKLVKLDWNIFPKAYSYGIELPL